MELFLMAVNFSNIKKRLDAPVPLFWRRLGAAFTAVGALTFSTDIMSSHPMIQKVIVVSAFVGAFLTNFAKENESKG